MKLHIIQFYDKELEESDVLYDVDVYMLANKLNNKLYSLWIVDTPNDPMPKDFAQVKNELNVTWTQEVIDLKDYAILTHSQAKHILSTLSTAQDELGGKDKDSQWYRDMAAITESMEILEGVIK